MKTRPCHPWIAALLLVFAMGCTQKARAPRPTATEGPVTVTLNTNQVFLGDSFRLEAAIRAPQGARVEVTAPGVPPAVVMRNSRAATESDGTRQYAWEMIGLRPGNHLVWTGTVQQVGADGTSLALPIPPLRIEIAPSRQPDDLSIKDIAGLQHWPSRIWARALVMLALVAALAALLAWGIRHYPRRRIKVIARPTIPPHEAAWAALLALRNAGIPNSPEGVESYFVQLSAIVRRYLEDAFNLRAPEQTTEEFIRSASTSQKLKVDHQQLVVGFLEQSDLVKFARYIPQSADMTAALDAALRLVDETKPAPANPPANSSAHAP